MDENKKEFLDKNGLEILINTILSLLKKKANVSDIPAGTLTIGNYTFNGKDDVTIPVYDGTIE